MDNSTVILLVEDEVLVRMLAADVLSEAGFTVLESTNAEEALTFLEARPDVQVLFTDVNMPGALDGLGLAQTVHERSPGVGTRPADLIGEPAAHAASSSSAGPKNS